MRKERGTVERMQIGTKTRDVLKEVVLGNAGRFKNVPHRNGRGPSVRLRGKEAQ